MNIKTYVIWFYAEPHIMARSSCAPLSDVEVEILLTDQTPGIDKTNDYALFLFLPGVPKKGFPRARLSGAVC